MFSISVLVRHSSVLSVSQNYRVWLLTAFPVWRGAVSGAHISYQSQGRGEGEGKIPVTADMFGVQVLNLGSLLPSETYYQSGRDASDRSHPETCVPPAAVECVGVGEEREETDAEAGTEAEEEH